MQQQEYLFRTAVRARKTYTGPVYVQEGDNPMCGNCGGIVDVIQGVTLDGKYTFHARCIRCEGCGQNFTLAEDVRMVEGKIYCLRCIPKTALKEAMGGRRSNSASKQKKASSPPRAIATRCYRCHQTLQPNHNVVDGHGMRWHKRCFVCTVCTSAVTDEDSYLHQSLPVHLRCAGSLAPKVEGSGPMLLTAPTMMCISCAGKVENGSEYREIGGNCYHVRCARCRLCGAAITSQCQVRGDELWCASCAQK